MQQAIHMRRQLSGFSPSVSAPADVALQPLSQMRPEALHALLQQSYAGGGGTVGNFDEWWGPLTQDSEFDPALVLIAANAGGNPIGLAQCWTSGFLKDLVVAPAARNRRIGSWLLDKTFATFAARGATHLDLKVEADNIAARRFYERHGMAAVAP